MKKFLLSLATLLTSASMFAESKTAAALPFSIDLTQSEVSLPEGVTQGTYPQNSAAFNGSQHGWMWFVATFNVEGPVDITLGGCQYTNEGYEAYLEADGVKVADIATKTSACWDADKANNVGTYSYTGGPATLSIFCGQYCPYVEVKEGKVTDENVKEKVLYKTNFQDWKNISASTSETEVKLTTTDGQDLTFTLFNTSCSPTGTNAKFTADIVSDGYLMTAKDATNVPYIITSPLDNITSFEVVQAATGGNRGLSVYVKGDGDEDWVELHNKSISNAAGEKLSFTVNRKNCQIKFSSFAPAQNAYILSLSISGNVAVKPRTFKPFKINFRTDPYTIVEPADGILEGVSVVAGKFHDAQHGYSNNVTVKVAVDGPVKFAIGGCGFGNSNTITNRAGKVLATISDGGCDSNTSYEHYATWTYNFEEADTLTITNSGYLPFIMAEPCDFIPSVVVTYFNTDGKKLGEEEILGGSELVYKYTAADVTVPEGQAFRGWFDGKTPTARKVAEGKSITEDIFLFARATEIEKAVVGSHYDYDLTAVSWYQEDHELIEIDGKYYNNHGWVLGANGTIKIQVAGNCYVNIKCCQYSNSENAVVTDAAGNTVVESLGVKPEKDGAVSSFQYAGPATTLTITYPNGSYVHGVEIYNVENFIAFDETTGYYTLSAGDASSLMLILKSAKSGDKIFLPNGVYDFGQVVLTTISANNLSIIGESMKGTIIKNAPDASIEGIGTTATLLNTSDGLYLQDLTIQNAMTFNGGTGRAVCLQDKGKNTICKNVCLLSYQDTYYSNAASNFYWEDCEIHGVVDYLCGDGDVVYNRTKLVNESIKNTTIAAPYTSASCKWGYVMLDCEIETYCTNFNFGRSWGGDSKLQYIRCKDLSNKLVGSRWNTEGMNVAAYKFMEYGNMDKDGNITTPASNIVNFTHSSGNKKYETVLTAEQAAEYTVANIYGAWAPDSICAQVTDLSKGTIFLVDGKITTTVPTEGTLRIANGRGGFGPLMNADGTLNVKNVEIKKANNARAYDLSGRQTNAKGLFIQNGKVIMIK